MAHYNPAALLLQVESVADMDLNRAMAVGRAFDEDPDLRPLRVGGDPARIRVEPGLEALIQRSGLPLDWLTERTKTRTEFEGGEISLRLGRGGYTGWPSDNGEWKYVLIPHKVQLDYLRSWTDSEHDRLDRIAALFGRLCEALDACYGIATTMPRSDRIPPVDVGIGEVGWLNFFGPAFVERWPALAETGLSTVRLTNGGAMIRVSGTPWLLGERNKQALTSALPGSAFVRGLENRDRYENRGVLVPSYEDHMRFSPGTAEMPWQRRQAEAAAAKAQRSRERRYANARRRREAASIGREISTLPQPAEEWSFSFDADDWKSFGRSLFRRLGGELAAPLGRALVDEMTSAPVGTEESMLVSSKQGAVEVRWFIDDVERVDVYIFGPPGMHAAIDSEYERWGDR